MNVKSVDTQDDGLHTTTLDAPGGWLGSVRYSLGDCPAHSASPQEYDELSVDFPCVSRDVDVEVTYTPVENDCGQPTRSPFAVQGLATTEIALEGGSGKEVWQLVLNPNGTFDGTVES